MADEPNPSELEITESSPGGLHVTKDYPYGILYVADFAGTGAGNLSNAVTLDSPHNTPETQRPQSVHVELSERRRRSGDTVPVAACDLAEVESFSSPICNLARKLLALGVDPATHLSIWRGEMRCFHNAPLGRWAELTVEEGGTGPVFRRYKPFPGRAVASQGAESDG